MKFFTRWEGSDDENPGYCIFQIGPYRLYLSLITVDNSTHLFFYNASRQTTTERYVWYRRFDIIPWYLRGLL